MKCGDANIGGNVALFYKGGCQKDVGIQEAYRCVGCGGYFHYECILKHFELEEGHDNARNALRKIKEVIENVNGNKLIIRYCNEGLEPNKKLLERSKIEKN